MTFLEKYPEAVPIKSHKPKARVDSFLTSSSHYCNELLLTKTADEYISNGHWALKLSAVKLLPKLFKSRLDKAKIQQSVIKLEETCFIYKAVTAKPVFYLPALGQSPNNWRSKVILSPKPDEYFVVNADYYDYLARHIPDLNFKSTKQTSEMPLYIYSGKKRIGFLMPCRINSWK